MKHVLAFDINKGKSTLVINDSYKQRAFERTIDVFGDYDCYSKSDSDAPFMPMKGSYM